MATFPGSSSEEPPPPKKQGVDNGPAPHQGVGEPEPSVHELHPEPGQLLDDVLNPLLDDFSESFARGLFLLDHCPDRVLSEERRKELYDRLIQAQAALAAARALRAASSSPMALDMAIIQPWHALVVEVWSLSSAMRLAGLVDPE